MDEIKLWKIMPGVGKAQAVSVGTTAQTETEALLEDVLSTSSELLMSGLTAIGRQITTPSGPLDLLGVDEDGNLVIFELKRGNLTRDAVAQIIDYAACFADFDVAKLCSCVSSKMSVPGAEKIEDFRSWYEVTHERPLANALRAKLVLVGLGVDERAKRMVEFLSVSGMDISMITFQGFQEGNQTYLARQVEVTSRGVVVAEEIKSGKAANLAKLTSLLTTMNIRTEYEQLFSEVRNGMGDSTYPYPYPAGYSFTLPGPTPSGGQTALARLALYVYEKHPGKIRAVFQPRTVKDLGVDTIKIFAKELGADLTISPAAYAEFYFEAKRANAPMVLGRVGRAIEEAWKLERKLEEAVTAQDAKAVNTVADN